MQVVPGGEEQGAAGGDSNPVQGGWKPTGNIFFLLERFFVKFCVLFNVR